MYIAPEFRTEYSQLLFELSNCKAEIDRLVSLEEYEWVECVLEAQEQFLSRLDEIEQLSKQRPFFSSLVTLAAKAIVEASVVRK
jgi:hypothetical protein